MVNREGENIKLFNRFLEFLVGLLAIINNPLYIPIFLLIMILYFLFRKEIAQFVDSNIKLAESQRKKISIVVVILLLLIVFNVQLKNAFDDLYVIKPPDDLFVVAIAPFSSTDESEQYSTDSIIAEGLKKRLEEERNLNIKIILLDNKINDIDDAKYQGEKVGAHLVIYGKIRKNILNQAKISYFLVTLTSLKLQASDAHNLNFQNEKGVEILSGSVTDFLTTEKTIRIIENFKENTTTVVYTRLVAN